MVSANTFFRTNNLLFYQTAYIVTACLAYFSSLFSWGVWMLPLLVFVLLNLTIISAPYQIRWSYHRQRRHGVYNRQYIVVIAQSFLNIFVSIGLYAALYYRYGLVLNDKLVNVDWWEALYFSGVTWTTVGYGDMIAPRALLLIPTIEAINGYLAMAVMMALIFKHIDMLRHFEVVHDDEEHEQKKEKN